MKYLFIVLVVFSLNLTKAERNDLSKKIRISSKVTFGKGTIVSNIGIGVFSAYKTPKSIILIPPVYTTLEFGLTDRIGLGLLAGYHATQYKEESNIYTVEQNFSHIILQARVAYHLIHRDKIDFYIGISAGYTFMTLNDKSVAKIPGATVAFPTPEKLQTPFAPGIYAGIRYYLTNQVAIFGEAGYSIAFISGGICYRFQ
ncbi:MAG: hypothetical protein SFY32_09125 [Bacteroidota bacterium]|nr:hypothetical protein [Bacteroidota bacterium]